ncbi:MAG TPA: hypothetical protein VIT44_13450 [Cyclobacteriaceae bacterium]
MKSKFLLPLLSIQLILFSGCEDEAKKISNSDLLTNQSSKTWYLLKIRINLSTAQGPTVVMLAPLSCTTDDENIFQADGKYLIDNKGTMYNILNPDFFGAPEFCKDTIDIIETNSWSINEKMDSLTISSTQYVYGLKILKITTDSLIVFRGNQHNTVGQTEYYVSKK